MVAISLPSTLPHYLTILFIAHRIWLANRMPIMDCDEVYNYWEPLHYWLYGYGLQTWEYANVYALRTYAYLLPLQCIATLLQPILGYLPMSFWTILVPYYPTNNNNNNVSTKLTLFWTLRALLAGVTGYAEVQFCQAIAAGSTSSTKNNQSNNIIIDKATKEKDNNDKESTTIGIVTAILLLSSTGMSHAAGALLPSSTLTCLWLLAAASYLQNHSIPFVIYAVSATLAIGWPFGVAMFVPMGLAILYREQKLLPTFLIKIIIITLIIQFIVLVVDYTHYKKIVSPVWNILRYNTGINSGDELYGVEPTSYYIKNLILNFNIVAVVGIIALPCTIFVQQQQDFKYTIVLSSMYLWLLIVVPRPHKEERFLYTIYPSLCFGAALVMNYILKTLGRISMLQKFQATLTCTTTQIVVWVPFILLSIGRTMALSKYYTAPLIVYTKLSGMLSNGNNINNNNNSHYSNIQPVVVCTCGEWYRFPSSFFLVDNDNNNVIHQTSSNDKYYYQKHLAFVRSSFEGQLPQPFQQDYGSGPLSTNQFNDLNSQHTNVYTEQEQCDYLIDLPDSTSCQSYNDDNIVWEPIIKVPFLNAEQTNFLHRIMYIPFFHNGIYEDYVVFQRK